MSSREMKRKLSDNLYAIMTAVIAMLFSSLSFIDIEVKSPKEWVNISMMSVASFILGQSIKTLMRMHGIKSGERVPQVIEAVERHRKLVPVVVVNIVAVEKWCQRKNDELRAQQRAVILAAEGLAYEDCFDEAGAAKPVSFEMRTGKLTRADKVYNEVVRRKMRAYEKAVRLERTELSASLLQGRAGRDDPYKVGRDIGEYMAEKTRNGVLSTVGISVATAIFSAQFVRNPNWGNVFMIVAQLTLHLLIGAWNSSGAKRFMCEEYRRRMDKISDIIEMFIREEGL